MAPSPMNRSERQGHRYLLVVLVASTAAILAALGFQYIGGYKPCPLCLQERYAYYLAIPAAALAQALWSAERRGGARALLAVIAAAYAINTVLGVYHAGVEWHWWAGPATCAGDLPAASARAGNLMKDLEASVVIRCDEAPWRLAGLSFAGWNAVISAGLMSLALYALRPRPE
jgi:disulfide bond formation protein DsbB